MRNIIAGLSKKEIKMARPSKLTKELQQQIGKSIALGLIYALAAASAGITYQTFNDWMNKGKF